MSNASSPIETLAGEIVRVICADADGNVVDYQEQ
jgi:hypothetical protein